MIRTRGPSTEIYLRADIANVLRAIDLANSELSTAVPIAEVIAYRAGFVAALRSVAAAFDLEALRVSRVAPPETTRTADKRLSGKSLD